MRDSYLNISRKSLYVFPLQKIGREFRPKEESQSEDSKMVAYTVTVFASWADRFPTWADLKAWLQSAEGGSLRVVEPREGPLAIVRYDKSKSDFSKEHVAWCRSVVVNKETRRVVSVAPPKSGEWKQEVFDTITTAEEFVDGTMLHVYIDSATKEFGLATRSRLGANNRFYRDGPTFREMFEEATVAVHHSEPKTLLKGSEDVTRFASVVVQHPRNRVVKAIETPSLVVVHQGTVSADGSVSIEEDPTQFGVNDDAYVMEYSLDALKAVPTVLDWVQRESKERGYGWQGVVLKDGKGGRWRIRSDVYETVRKLRGNDTTNEDRFARLRKARAIDQYLSFFPEDKKVLYELEGDLRANTRKLYRQYVATFITKEQKFHELLWPFKHHVSQLHNMFKDLLRPHGKKMDLDQVIGYVNRLNVEDTANLLRPQTAPKASVTESKAEAEA